MPTPTPLPKPKKAGRPPYIPTARDRFICQALAACGNSQEEMATFFRISEPTLRRAFKAELRDGAVTVIARTIAQLARKAMAGDNACMFFLLKTRGGFRENAGLAHTFLGKDGKPVDLDQLSDSAIDQIINTLRTSINAPEHGDLSGEAAVSRGRRRGASSLEAPAGTTD